MSGGDRGDRTLEATADDTPNERPAAAAGASGSAPATDPLASDTAHAATAAGTPLPTVDDAVGKTFGRYQVQARVGAGGMGVVYKARDPALDRIVALKVLPPLDPELREPLEARLRREAQALAKVDHEHVIAVHDVGVAAESVFIAMQFVDGTTLDRYLEAHRPPPRRVLALFAAAGRGLAAAHAAGIVHRDFKPANVLVDRAHRPYVGDFGLARGIDDADAAPAGGAGHSLLEVDVTRTGAVMGTPLFMAPEQHRGEAATARADQFSFCISLWLALFGAHPFATGRWERGAAIAAMAADRITEPTRPRGVPARAVRALRRGLRHDPAQRWPAMTELIAAIEPPSRARWVLGGLTAAGVASGIVLSATVGGVVVPDRDPCANVARPILAVWNQDRRGTLTEAFAATKLPYAADLAERVGDRIDARAREWSSMRIDACRATRVGGVQSDQLLDRRMACLDQRLVELDAALGVLTAAPTADAVDRSVDAIGALPAIALCGDLARVGGVEALPADPAARARVQELLRDLAIAAASLAAGTIAGSQERAAALLDRARGAGSAVALARALDLAAAAHLQSGDAAAAIPAWREAASVAARAHDDRLAGAALLHVAQSLQEEGKDAEVLLVLADAEVTLARAGDQPDQLGMMHRLRGEALRVQSRFPDAEAALDRAIALFEAGGDQTELELAAALTTSGSVLADVSKFEPARDRMRRAVEIVTRRSGPDHPKVGVVRTGLGKVLMWMGDNAGAQQELEAALRIRRARLPADHPSIASTLHLLGMVALQDGRLGDADGRFVGALAILERNAPDHPNTWITRYQLGVARRQAGKLDEALALFEDVLARRRAKFGEEHAGVANVLDAIGNVLRQQGKVAEAIARKQRALAIREQIVGAETEDVAISLVGLAEINVERGACREAIPQATRALAIVTKVMPDGHSLGAPPRAILAMCDRQAGRLVAARAGLEQALALVDRGGTPEERVTIRFELARTLWALGERDPARRRAEEARDRLRAEGGDPAQKAAIEEWLARPR